MAKIVRVEMEFDDGTVQRLTGDQAEYWLNAANGACVTSALHGIPFPKFQWEDVKQEDDNEDKAD